MKTNFFKMLTSALVVGAVTLSLSAPASAQKKNGVGVTDTEIKVGGIGPFSGVASSYASNPKSVAAYFDKINAEGGINGRKINFIVKDDGYNPAKTLEMARRLVEQDEVALVLDTLGTAPNAAIQKYLNDRKIPMVFVSSGAARFSDLKNYPWSTSFSLSLPAEAGAAAQHLLETKPNAKIAVLYQNDDFGKDLLKGLENVLGERAASMIVAKASYETSDPTVDSQVLTLKASGADTFFDFSTPKSAAQAIKKMAEIGWKPTHYLSSASSSVSGVLTPAGLENSVGIYSLQYIKEPTDPQWANDPATKEWEAFMKKYNTSVRLDDYIAVYGYTVAQAFVELLKKCGDDLTQENIRKQMLNLDFPLPMLIPGVRVKTSPTDGAALEQGQLSRFDGKTWVRFGKVYGNN